MWSGFVIFLVSFGNSLAYFTSNSSHGIWLAGLIQQLSEFMWSSIGWLKSRNVHYILSIGLYIDLTLLYSISVRKLQEKRVGYNKILAIIITENIGKVSKIKHFDLNRQIAIKSYHYSLFLIVGLDGCLESVNNEKTARCREWSSLPNINRSRGLFLL